MPPGSPLHPVLLAILTHAIDKSLSHELHYTQARGLVESWLSSVEASMRATLRAEARRCMREYAGLPGVALSSGGTSWAQLEAASEPGLAPAIGSSAVQGESVGEDTGSACSRSGLTRAQWAACQPAQLAVVVSNVYWCQAVKAALLAGGGDSCSSVGDTAPEALWTLAARCSEQLEELLCLVRGGLTALQRQVSPSGQ